ncbi:hypothetical protein DFJ73DRAFT_635472 [Zopfochytrium polystomum]|nr:hypothetical protein DFJ73DRAFT_635472 [Zopfochytrium polystomum]
MEIGRDAGRQADGEAETEVDKEAVRLEHPFAEHAAGGAADGAAEPLYYTWVDASDLSYHNFESILPLDRILRRPGGAQPSDSDSPLSLSLSNVKRLHPQMDVFSGTLSGTDLPLLYQLDGLGLYLEPANSGQRGGKRMIFNSAALARGLTTAARWSQLFKIIENGASQLNESPWATSNRFCFVNDVFRLNKFEPTDRRFRLHRDTPYYDGVRGLVSKYTMLIYLSAGETPSGSLTIYDGSDLRAGEEMGESDSKKCVVENIASAQCIIFDQRYPHEGDPFDSGAKIFLRTELIYWLPRSVKHVPRIGSLFSSAVYYTLQSVFDNELAKHADRLYESANRSHWGLPETTDLDSDDLEPVLFKKWRGLDFATDGYSYWFPMPSVSYIKQCAVLVVLDFFNGKLSEMGDSFRKDCKTTSAIPPKRSTAASLESWVLRHLRSAECKHPPIPREREHRNTVLLKHENSADPERRMWAKQQDESFDRSDLDCCLYHGRDPKPWTCKHSFDEYVFWMETALTKTRSAAIVILGRELSYDPEAVVVRGNAVRFCGKDLGRWGVPSFNFAACQSFGDFERSFVKRKYVGLRAEMSGLPPLPFEFVGAKTGGVRGVRFRAEFFKNDWAVSIKGGTVKVPVFMDY